MAQFGGCLSSKFSTAGMYGVTIAFTRSQTGEPFSISAALTCVAARTGEIARSANAAAKGGLAVQKPVIQQRGRRGPWREQEGVAKDGPASVRSQRDMKWMPSRLRVASDSVIQIDHGDFGRLSFMRYRAPAGLLKSWSPGGVVVLHAAVDLARGEARVPVGGREQAYARLRTWGGAKNADV